MQHATAIRPLVRLRSDTLTTACRQRGLPMDLAELCGGLLASVIEDLTAIPALKRTDFERTKRLVRVIAACQEPAASALRLAMAAAPINGEAALRHWDMVCEPEDKGRMAWLLNFRTDASERYGRRAH